MPFIKSKIDCEIPVNLYYEDWGKGKPIVLIHGWPVSHEMWEYQSTILPRHGFRVIMYDRRGFGQSDKPWDGYDYTTLANDLKAIMDELDLHDVTLVGFSMAGGEVIRYCSRFNSARVAKAILISSIVPYMLKTDTNPDGLDKEVFDGMITRLVEDRPAFLDGFGKDFFGQGLINRPVSEQVLGWMHGLGMRGSPRATIECGKTYSQTDFRSELQDINIPVLLLHGDADKTVPIKPTSEQAAQLIPHAIFKVYEGAPHGLFITEKEQLTADIIQFVNEGTVMFNYVEPIEESVF